MNSFEELARPISASGIALDYPVRLVPDAELSGPIPFAFCIVQAFKPSMIVDLHIARGMTDG